MGDVESVDVDVSRRVAGLGWRAAEAESSTIYVAWERRLTDYLEGRRTKRGRGHR